MAAIGAPMRVLLVCDGAVDEVQPYVFLVRALVQQHGCLVSVWTQPTYHAAFAAGGPSVCLTSMQDHVPSLSLSATETEREMWWDEHASSAQDAVVEGTAAGLGRTYPQLWSEVLAARPDLLVVHGVLLQPACLAVGQRLQIPVICCSTYPLTASGEYAPVGLFSSYPASASASPRYPAFLNHFLHRRRASALWSLLGDGVNAFRSSIGLPPQEALLLSATPMLHWVPPSLWPRPADWPPDAHLLPAPHTDLAPGRSRAGDGAVDDAAPWSELVWPAALQHFLAEDTTSRLALVAFAAVPVRAHSTLAGALTAALEQHGLRAVLVLEGAPWDVLWPRSVLPLPHASPLLDLDRLAARCCVAVHAGRSDVLRACWRARVPQVLCAGRPDRTYAYVAGRPALVGPLAAAALTPASLAAAVGQALQHGAPASLAADAAGAGAESADRRADGAQLAAQLLLAYARRLRNRGRTSQQWQRDEDVLNCQACAQEFWLLRRRHHCRACGRIYCADCMTQHRLPNYPPESPPLVCKDCATTLQAAMRESDGLPIVDGLRRTDPRRDGSDAGDSGHGTGAGAAVDAFSSGG